MIMRPQKMAKHEKLNKFLFARPLMNSFQINFSLLSLFGAELALFSHLSHREKKNTDIDARM